MFALCFLRFFVASSGARYFLRLAFFPEDLLVFSLTVFLTGFFATFLTFAFTTFRITDIDSFPAPVLAHALRYGHEDVVVTSRA